MPALRLTARLKRETPSRILRRLGVFVGRRIQQSRPHPVALAGSRSRPCTAGLGLAPDAHVAVDERQRPRLIICARIVGETVVPVRDQSVRALLQAKAPAA